MTMTGLHPSRPIPRPQGPGAMHLNTSAGEKKETVSNSKALHSIPVHDFWCPTRWGVGFLRAGVLSPHQSEIPGHPCLFQTRNPGRTGAVFPPRIPIKIHGLLMNIIPFIYLISEDADDCKSQVCQCDKIAANCFAANLKTYNKMLRFYNKFRCRGAAPAC